MPNRIFQDDDGVINERPTARSGHQERLSGCNRYEHDREGHERESGRAMTELTFPAHDPEKKDDQHDEAKAIRRSASHR
jgi:hypothetical protein